MKNLLTIFFLVILTSCASTNKTNHNVYINVPKDIREGRCEQQIPKVSGVLASDLVKSISNLIDRIKECKAEKGALIEILDSFNQESK